MLDATLIWRDFLSLENRMELLPLGITSVGAFSLGVILVYLIIKNSSKGLIQKSEERAKKLLFNTEHETRELLLRAENSALDYRKKVESEIRELRREVSKAEKRVNQREENLQKRTEKIDRLEQSVNDRVKNISLKEEEVENLSSEIYNKLEEISSLTIQQARTFLLNEIEKELEEEITRRVKIMEASVHSQAEKKSQKILTTIMQRMTADITSENTVSTIVLPSDDLKGRIIGREGRNIRAFEAATGCDLIIDDTPALVTVSGFDPVRREIATRSLTRLVKDGRIQPTRIESIVNKEKSEVEKVILEAGEQLIHDAGTPNIHPELIKTLGKLKFRYSYGQNQLRHVLETSWLAAAIAFEIGADVEVARMGGLLHDIGKAIDREMEGTHALIGADLAKRFGVSDEIVHCIAAHHEEIRPASIEAMVVICADAISGSRPGARRESAEQYIKRLEALETIANSYEGVNETFAIQAGREVRVLVNPETITDIEATRLARDISNKIEETLVYPGEIKVTVIRETRTSTVAR